MVSRTAQEQIKTRGSLIDDTLTPTSHDANSVDLADTLDYVCSQIADILGESAWETAPDLSIAGIAAKTFLDEKLALREILLLTDISVPANVYATGTLTITPANNALDTETVTIGTKTYTFQTTLTDVNGNVQIGVDGSTTLDNLIAAINLGAGAGTLYAASTTLNPDVSAAAGALDTMDVTAKIGGTTGNSIATTEAMTNGSWGGTVLSGGAGDIVALSVASSEVPGGKVKAIGAGVVEGLVTATNATWGAWSAAEVTGDNAINPKNLLQVVDGATGDPILSSGGYRIWGLLQNETGATDAAAFTDTTPERAMVSFVIINATHTDLIHVNGADIGGQTVNLSFIERTDLDSWVEQDFLRRSAFVDIGSGAAAGVTLDNVVDNQGATPVTQSSDINWRVADSYSWSLQTPDGARKILNVAPAVAGDELEINADTVDINVGATGVVDIDNGITVDSGGTSINLGVTPGQIDATAIKIDATAGVAEVEGVGVTLDGTSGNIVIDGVIGDIDFTDASHIIQAANNAGTKVLTVASRNSGAGAGNLYLEADDNIYFETALETTGLAFDETGKKISTLWSQSFTSLAAAIEYAGDRGGQTVKMFVLGSNYAAGVNIPAATVDLTAYTLGWPASGGTSTAKRALVFLDGRLLSADAASGGSNDIYPGTTPASGDLMHNFPKPFLPGSWLFTLALA